MPVELRAHTRTPVWLHDISAVPRRFHIGDSLATSFRGKATAYSDPVVGGRGKKENMRVAGAPFGHQRHTTITLHTVQYNTALLW
jgi:hypothetical protein